MENAILSGGRHTTCEVAQNMCIRTQLWRTPRNRLPCACRTLYTGGDDDLYYLKYLAEDIRRDDDGSLRKSYPAGRQKRRMAAFLLNASAKGIL